MKTLQKLELSAGIAALIAALSQIGVFLYIYFVHVHNAKDEITAGEITNFLIPSGLIILFPTLFAIGAYYDVMRRSRFAIAAICISGFLIIIYFSLTSIFFIAYGAIANGLLIISPGIFAATTIILALYSRINATTR